MMIKIMMMIFTDDIGLTCGKSNDPVSKCTTKIGLGVVCLFEGTRIQVLEDEPERNGK